MADRALVINRMVHFVEEDEEGNRFCSSAMVIATKNSIRRTTFATEQVGQITDEDNVHLMVFSSDPGWEDEHTLREYDVEPSTLMEPGSYHWQDECKL